jgi:hypothetical protein
MKRIAILVVLGFFGFTLAEKPELKPYGFIKGDMYYSSGGISSWGQSAITCSQLATGTDTSAVSFTGQHSRFGLKGTGKIGNMETGGRLELDFFWVSAEANTKPRMRLGYAWIKPMEGLEIRVGQQWDIIGPLNPATNNTNANLWKNGNYGFRRGQFQVRYQKDLEGIIPNIQLSVGEGAKDAANLGKDNLSGIPMLQGRVGLGFAKKMEVGVAGMYTAVGEDIDYSTTGFILDVSLPLHKLCAFKGEFAQGKNFSDANLFTVGPGRVANEDIESMGFWGNVISKPLPHLHVVLGFAQEHITSDVADAGIETSQAAYATLIFPIGGGFSLAAEWENLVTTYGNGSDNSANVFDFAGKLVF